MNDLISIIMPSYNSQLHISEAIESVLHQTYQNWELLIVDDGSSDDTINIISKYRNKDSRISLLKRNREPKCAATSRNIGLENSKGDFVIFFDSDDILAPFCLNQRIKEIKRRNKLDFVVFQQYGFLDNLESAKIVTKFHKRNRDLHIMGTSFMWQTMAPIWKKSFLMKIGGFNEKYKIFDDDGLNFKAVIVFKGKFSLIKHLPPDSFYRSTIFTRNKEYFFIGTIDLKNYILDSIKFAVNKKNKKNQYVFNALFSKYLIYSFQSEKVEMIEMDTILNQLKINKLIGDKNFMYFQELIKTKSYHSFTQHFENVQIYRDLWFNFHKQTSLIKYSDRQRKLKNNILKILKLKK